MQILSFLLLGFCSLAISAPSGPTTTVDLGYTKYQGTSLSNGISQWLGMRYAAPPVGNLRFRAPQDPIAASTLQKASKYGDICIPQSTTVPSGHSEDCLFLNVFAPSNALSKKLPVFIWIPGGGFNSVSGANSMNGSELIKASGNNIVIVTINYRVSMYGFIASKEVKNNGNVNAGLLDQRKAFQWVQKYISKFGGDPTHVTLGGGSAGGASINLHLTAYGGRNDGLFHATAAESPSYGIQYTISQSQYRYDNVALVTGCNSQKDTLSCLRSLPVAKLQSGNVNIAPPNTKVNAPIYMWSNVIDGDFTLDFTYRMFANNRFIKVPTIWGADTNDGTIFVPRSTTKTQSDMNLFLQSQFPPLTTAQLTTIDSLYPKAEQFSGAGAYWRSTSNAYGDMRYYCPQIKSSDIYLQQGQKTWNYRYNVQDPGQVTQGYGTEHTAEACAIWGPNSCSGAPASYFTSVNSGIVPVVQGYWTSFIRSKDPNTFRKSGTPTWDVWNKSGRILLETNRTKMENLSPEQRTKCTYLNGIGPSLQQK